MDESFADRFAGTACAARIASNPVVSTTSVLPSQWPTASPNSGWIAAGLCAWSMRTTRAQVIISDMIITASLVCTIW